MRRKYLSRRENLSKNQKIQKEPDIIQKEIESKDIDPFEIEQRKFDLQDSIPIAKKSSGMLPKKSNETESKKNEVNEILTTAQGISSTVSKIKDIKKRSDEFDKEINALSNEDFYHLDFGKVLPKSDYKSKVMELGKEISLIVEKTTNRKIKIMKLLLENEKKQTRILNNIIKDKMKKLLEEDRETQKLLGEETTSMIEKTSEQKLKVSKLQLENEIQSSKKINSKINKNLKEIERLDKEIRIQRNKLEDEIREKTEKLIQTERLSAIGELAARVAHDLRNPLSVIKGSTELIKFRSKNNKEEFYERQIGMIDRSINRMVHQIEDVLDFVKPLPINIKKNSLLETITSSAEKTKLPREITLKLPTNDVIFEFDKEKLDVVFDNILTNASQAMEGKGNITIRILEKSDQIVIEVEDSGPGIPKQILTKIFEPLVTTKQTGTGLGLSSCKGVIEQHGGEISVKNNPTTFTIKLPKFQK